LPKAEGDVPAAVQTHKKKDAETSSLVEGNLRKFKSLQKIKLCLSECRDSMLQISSNKLCRNSWGVVAYT